MAVLASIGNQQFNPQTRDIAFSVAADAILIRITLTHPNNWPTGPIVSFEIVWAGVSDGVTTISGGIANDKAGVPIVGNIVTTRQASKPAGLVSGTARIVVFQTLTTAALVESF